MIVRQMILKKCGVENISSFQLYSKERQKDIIREVMMELDAGPRQLSRVNHRRESPGQVFDSKE